MFKARQHSTVKGSVGEGLVSKAKGSKPTVSPYCSFQPDGKVSRSRRVLQSVGVARNMSQLKAVTRRICSDAFADP